MFAIIGVFIVLGCVIGGYVLEGGPLGVLMQPIELLIIGGAAIGSFFIASPKSIIFGTMKKAFKVFTASEASKQTFLDILSVIYTLMNMARRDGIVSIESHVNKPDGSAVFTKFPSVLKNHEVRDFICDNFKVLLAGNIEPHQFEALMDIDMAASHKHESNTPNAINKVADSLPGLGIVAAVLGVVLTMGKINEPPEVLGHSIGAALVGTFLGILMCYGFAGPMAQNLEYQVKETHSMLEVVKSGLVGFASGFPPMLAVEAARRAVSGPARPTFEELEGALKGGQK
ncbi:MAG: flagellar motor stator protein MotA [Proteobacteria bacterium]|nr:flagellar motor stator protein MotA [Pseudomonadota bacterium]